MDLVSVVREQVNHKLAAIVPNQFAAILNFSRPEDRVVDTKSADERLACSLTAEATAGCDVRFELMAALRESIAAGTYKVASSQVAEKLMDELGW